MGGLEESITKLNFNIEDYNYVDYRNLTDIKNVKNIRQTIQQYSGIIILFQEKRIEIEESEGSRVKTTHLSFEDYPFDMTEEFKNAVNNIPYGIYSTLSVSFTNFINEKTKNNYNEPYNIYLVNKKTQGGKKAVVKYTVKQLQAIASKNNIKITKKVDGKTVRLNKQGLIAKLKRYKVL
jgi:hypothetical protein